MSSAPTLKRNIGLVLFTLYGAGNILGAGVYALIGKVAGAAGLYSVFAFLLASLIAALTGLVYAELSARFPLSSGEAVYVDRAFHKAPVSLIIGILIALSGIVSAAVIARSFAGYLEIFIKVPEQATIAVALVILALIAVWGIKESLAVSALVTLVEIGGLILIISVAGKSFSDLPARLPELIPPLALGAWHGILLGGFLAFYAYIGFEDMVNIAEEVKEPEKTIPRGIFLALGISTLLYILVALAAVLSLDPPTIAASKAPMALIYEKMTGNKPTWIALISMFAIINGALVQIIMASRVLYGLARDGLLPKFLSQIHPSRRTPAIATFFVAGIILVFALWLPMKTLAAITSALILLVFSLINLSLILIKRKHPPAPPGVFVNPTWLPYLAFFATLGFVLARFASAFFSK